MHFGAATAPFFSWKAQGSDVELDEDWRVLSCYGLKRGDTVMLVVREPWQRTETAHAVNGLPTTVHLTIPEACVGVFEAVLDFMYRFHRDPRAEHTLPNLSAEPALRSLWLAGRLGMAELQEQVVEHLEGAVAEQNAHAYLPAGAGQGAGGCDAAGGGGAGRAAGGRATGCRWSSFDGRAAPRGRAERGRRGRGTGWWRRTCGRTTAGGGWTRRRTAA